MKLWIRLGGWITADKEEGAKISQGDSAALLSVIKKNGFDIDGGTYIPLPNEDIDFDLPFSHLNYGKEK